MVRRDDTPTEKTSTEDPISAFRGAFVGGQTSDELRERTRRETADEERRKTKEPRSNHCRARSNATSIRLSRHRAKRRNQR
jgi:hypothetical protein